MATIGDVAKLAGLSRTTVSRVINHHPYVSEEKKALVRQAMNELSYVPNSIAQNLRKQVTKTIAVLIPRISNPFFSMMVEVMENAAAENGYQLVVCQTMYSKERELVYLNLFKTKQFDGVILASIENDWNDIQDYTQYGPIVMCNEYDDRAEIPMIRLNQFEGGYIGAKHLLERGHNKIAHSRGNHLTNLTQDRKDGFLYALEESGLSSHDDWMFTGVSIIEDGRQLMRKIVQMNHSPTAIFTGSDEVAAGIIREAKVLNVKIPNDFAVVGFDDQPLARLMEPTLTTIYQPIKTISYQTMAVMFDMLKNPGKLERQTIDLSLHLIVREST